MLEKRGVPTAVIGTDEFLALGRLEARSRGIADLPIVLTAHPLGGLHEDEVRAKAAAMLPETLQALTGARP